MMHKTSRIYGFTLIEILVVVLTLGILVLLGAVQYSKTVEMNRAEQAIVLVKQIAAANHMYSLDSSGNYVSGQLTNNACNAAACPATLTGASPCDLIACHYMPQRDWGDNAQGDFATYDAYAVNPVNGSQPCKLGANSNDLACVQRNSTAQNPYNGWGYTVDITGAVQAFGGAPSQP